MASKKQRLDTNISINDNFLNIKKIGENLYKELGLTSNEKIDKNLKLKSSPDEKIGDNLYKKLESTLAKKIGKNLNNKLSLSFTYNNMHLRKKFAILITRTNKKVYKSKTYNKAITNLIHSTK